MTDYWDASAIASVVLDEPTAPNLYNHIRQSDAVIAVSDLGVAEVSSAVSRLLRMHERTIGQADTLIEKLDAWTKAVAAPVDLEREDVELAITIIRRFELNLRTADAIHAAVCLRLRARLVTLDQKLAWASGALGVEAIVPGAA